MADHPHVGGGEPQLAPHVRRAALGVKREHEHRSLALRQPVQAGPEALVAQTRRRRRGPERHVPRELAEHALAAALKDGLTGIPKVQLRTPRGPEASAGLVCCEVDGYDPREAVARLRAAKVIATSTPYEPSYLRFGPTIINSESDVEAALAAVRRL